MEFETTIKNLKANGYQVTHFETATEAAAYLDNSIDNKIVGMGDSATLDEMKLR